MDDSAILDMFFARDESAIGETQKKYENYLYTVAANILHSSEDAEECVNDTYYKAWETIPPKRPTFFKGFLAKITRSRSLDKYRANNAKKRGGNRVELLLSELEEAIPAAADVHAEYEKNLTADKINEFLRGLPKETRFIFMRRYWYADSVAAIAKGCRASEGKIKSSLFRTRLKLREYLG